MAHVIHHAIDVATSPERAWQVFCDLSRWPRWFPYAASARAEGGSGGGSGGGVEPWRPGGVILVELQVPVAGRLSLRLEIEAIEPGRRVRWHGAAYGVRGVHTYTFADHGRWTRVTSHEEFSAGLVGGLGLRAARGRIDEMTHRSLALLRDEVEQAQGASGGAPADPLAPPAPSASPASPAPGEAAR